MFVDSLGDLNKPGTIQDKKWVDNVQEIRNVEKGARDYQMLVRQCRVEHQFSV